MNRHQYEVSADHIVEEYSFNKTRVVVHVCSDGYFAIHPKLGCGKTYGDEVAAIMHLFEDHGCFGIVARKIAEENRLQPMTLEHCEVCPHCAYDHKFYGPGWVYFGNNGPVSPCPQCNPEGKHPRKR